jgi:biopolymer transport protein TolR
MRMSRRPMAEINVVPYIDVMLVLLVIFMITAPLLSQGINVELPRAAAKPLAQQKEPIIVSINVKGEYFLNVGDNPTQAKNLDAIKNYVSEALAYAKLKGERQSVFVKGDKRVDYDKVVQAMVFLQQAGAESVGLITQDPQ